MTNHIQIFLVDISIKGTTKVVYGGGCDSYSISIVSNISMFKSNYQRIKSGLLPNIKTSTILYKTKWEKKIVNNVKKTRTCVSRKYVYTRIYKIDIE